MTDNEFKALMDLLMYLDPWPVETAPGSQAILERFADYEASKRNYSDWIEAYHRM